jgi:hypothetical protein
MNPAANKCPTGHNEKQPESQLFKNAMDILCQRRGNECFNKLDVVGADAEIGVIRLHDFAPYIGLFQETQSVSGGFNDAIDTASLLQVCISPRSCRLARTSLIVLKLRPQSFKATVAAPGCTKGASYKPKPQPKPKPEPHPIDPGKKSRSRDEVLSITYCRLWQLSQIAID